MRDQLQSYDKDGSHAIQSAMVENPMLHEKFMSTFYRTDCRWKFYIAGIAVFECFCSWRYTGCANMNFLCQGFQKLSSDRKIHTDRQTQLKLYTTCFVGGQQILLCSLFRSRCILGASVLIIMHAVQHCNAMSGPKTCTYKWSQLDTETTVLSEGAEFVVLLRKWTELQNFFFHGNSFKLTNSLQNDSIYLAV